MSEPKDTWDEVAKLRALAEDAAREGNELLAAFHDTRASQMTERMRRAEALAKAPT